MMKISFEERATDDVLWILRVINETICASCEKVSRLNVNIVSKVYQVLIVNFQFVWCERKGALQCFRTR